MKYLLAIAVLALTFIAGFFTGQHNAMSDIKSEPQEASHQHKQPSDEAPKPLANSLLSVSESQDTAPSAPPTSSSQSEIDTAMAQQATEENKTSKMASDPSLSIQQRQQIANEQYPVAQQDFEEWSRNQKLALKEEMDAYIDIGADFMFEKIKEDNSLLNDPIAESSLEDDLAWRQRTEQYISALFQTLNTSGDAELQSLNCIQKQCQLTWTGSNTMEDSKLLLRLMSDLENHGLKEQPLSTVSLNQDNSYWHYVRLLFN